MSSSPAQTPIPRHRSDQASACAYSALHSESFQQLDQIRIADRDTLHRVAPRLVLFHHQPPGFCFAAGAQYFDPVQVAFSNFHVHRSTSIDRHVLDMHEGNSVLEAAYPVGRTRASELQPVRVQLCLESVRGSGAKERLQPGLSTEPLQLVAVVVINELQPRRARPTRQLNRFSRESPV